MHPNIGRPPPPAARVVRLQTKFNSPVMQILTKIVTQQCALQMQVKTEALGQQAQ